MLETFTDSAGSDSSSTSFSQAFSDFAPVVAGFGFVEGFGLGFGALRRVGAGRRGFDRFFDRRFFAAATGRARATTSARRQGEGQRAAPRGGSAGISSRIPFEGGRLVAVDWLVSHLSPYSPRNLKILKRVDDRNAGRRVDRGDRRLGPLQPRDRAAGDRGAPRAARGEPPRLADLGPPAPPALGDRAGDRMARGAAGDPRLRLGAVRRRPAAARLRAPGAAGGGASAAGGDAEPRGAGRGRPDHRRDRADRLGRAGRAGSPIAAPPRCSGSSPGSSSPPGPLRPARAPRRHGDDRGARLGLWVRRHQRGDEADGRQHRPRLTGRGRWAGWWSPGWPGSARR